MAGITRTTRAGLFALGFLAATGVEAVRADEAYLCEDGRIVKVALGKLEDLKRTDACIAAYYGLKIKPASRLETGAIAPTVNDPAIPAAASPHPVTPVAAKPRARSETLLRSSSQPLRAATGTDYRNVVVLNAAPGAPAVFRHEH